MSPSSIHFTPTDKVPHIMLLTQPTALRADVLKHFNEMCSSDATDIYGNRHEGEPLYVRRVLQWRRNVTPLEEPTMATDTAANPPYQPFAPGFRSYLVSAMPRDYTGSFYDRPTSKQHGKIADSVGDQHISNSLIPKGNDAPLAPRQGLLLRSGEFTAPQRSGEVDISEDLVNKQEYFRTAVRSGAPKDQAEEDRLAGTAREEDWESARSAAPEGYDAQDYPGFPPYDWRSSPRTPPAQPKPYLTSRSKLKIRLDAYETLEAWRKQMEACEPTTGLGSACLGGEPLGPPQRLQNPPRPIGSPAVPKFGRRFHIPSNRKTLFS